MSRKARPTIEEQAAALRRNMAAYETMRDELERNCMNKWVIIYENDLAGVYDSEQEALQDAALRFGWGPYHIRQVGLEPTYVIPTLHSTRPLKVPPDHADR